MEFEEASDSSSEDLSSDDSTETKVCEFELPACSTCLHTNSRISQHFYSVGMGLFFEAVVTQSKQVISVKGSYYSSVNDKGSEKCGNFISDLNNKDIYKDISYEVKTGLKEEDFVEISNCFVIADGGYLEWPATITGFPGISSDPAEYKFTDWVASVRKDVDCFRGILKKIFIFFKYPITLRSIEDINNAFYTACVINNMILKHDGLDKLWLDDKNCEDMLKDDCTVREESILDIYTTVVRDNVYFLFVKFTI